MLQKVKCGKPSCHCQARRELQPRHIRSLAVAREQEGPRELADLRTSWERPLRFMGKENYRKGSAGEVA